MRLHPRLPAFLVALALASGARAENTQSVYVIDKLLVGVHAEKDLDSAILEVFPTGTKFEVVARDGELAQVVGPDKVKGWVDAAYLTEQPPAELLLPQLEQENAALEARIKELEQGGAMAPSAPAAGAAAAPGAPGEVDTLMRENTALKDKLSDEKLKSGQLQSEVASLRGQLDANATPPDARIISLEHTRDELERELATTRDRLVEYEARASLDDSSVLLPVVLRDYFGWLVGFLLIFGAAAFGGGMYVLDALNRRRHGGFRV